jgi:hypothetical protein
MPWDRLAVKDQVLRWKNGGGKGSGGRHEARACRKEGQGMYGLDICRKVKHTVKKNPQIDE